MMRRIIWCTLMIFLVAQTAYAHLCNNIFWTPDRVIVKPEKQSLALAKEDTFRVFVQNNYPAPLHNVRLIVQSEDTAVKVNVSPSAIEDMKPGERTAFTVKVTLDGDGTPRKVLLRFAFSAREIDFRPVQECSNEELYRHLPSPSNYGDNVLAAETLVRRKDPKGAQWLIQFMNDSRVRNDYRSRAIRALGKAGTAEHIAPIKAFLSHRDGFLKGNALLALGCLKCAPETFTPFFADKDEFVRTCALAGAALAGQKELLPKLREALSSTDPYVRIACGWALAAHRNKEGIAVLDAALATRNAMQLIMAGDALTDIAARNQALSP